MGLQCFPGPGQDPLVVPCHAMWLHLLVCNEPSALSCQHEQNWQLPTRCSLLPTRPRKGRKALFLRKSSHEHNKDNPLGGIQNPQNSLNVFPWIVCSLALSGWYTLSQELITITPLLLLHLALSPKQLKMSSFKGNRISGKGKRC